MQKRNRKTVCLRSAGESQDHPADWFPGAAGLPKGGHMVLRRLSLDVCVKSLSQFPLWDPMDCNLPGSSVHGIFQARILEWVPISYSREFSLRIKPPFLVSPALSGRFFTTASPIQFTYLFSHHFMSNTESRRTVLFSLGLLFLDLFLIHWPFFPLTL